MPGIFGIQFLKPNSHGRRMGQMGRFLLTGKIGSGGFAEVHKAWDLSRPRISESKRKIAVKVAQDASYGEFFIENEGRILSSLPPHRNIIKLIDRGIFKHRKRGKTEAKNYLVLEYFEGRNVEDIIVSSPLPVDTALKITSQTALALAYAHEHGIVHADVKPANILYDGSTAKLFDFAFARREGEGLEVEKGRWGAKKLGKIAGSPQHCSLSRLEYNPPTRYDDMFALGVSLYEILTGEPAISEESLLFDHMLLGQKILRLKLPGQVKRLILGMTGTTHERGVHGKYRFHDFYQVLSFIKFIRRDVSRPVFSQQAALAYAYAA